MILKGVTKSCPICGKEFYRRPSQSSSTFCCKECSYIDKRNNVDKQKTGKWIICKICERKKYYPLNRFKRWTPKFCSNECKYEDFIRNNTKKGILVGCNECGKLVYRTKCDTGTGGVYCSKSCAAKTNIKNLGTRMFRKKHTETTKKLMSKSQTGMFRKKKDKYLTDISNFIRSRIEYQNYRSSGFIRDNFTCQDCGQIGGKLQFHHKVPFSSIIKFYLDKYGKDGILFHIFDSKILFDLDFGITLCLKCHKKTDTFLRKINHQKYFDIIKKYDDV